MPDLQHVQSRQRDQRSVKNFSLSIGLRLFLAFLVIIILTGLIGIVSIQQISSLTNTTAELNAHDLPEAILLEQLRSLLYQQDGLEHSLVNGNELFPNQSSLPLPPEGSSSAPTRLLAMLTPTSTPGIDMTLGQQTPYTVSNLIMVLKEIQKDCQQMLTFERSENGEDYLLIQQVIATTGQTDTLSSQIQSLAKRGQLAQARSMDFAQQEPLLRSAVTVVTRMIGAEQSENARDMIQTQQESGQSVLFVLILTAFCLLLSMGLAILITRSLTRPLTALLQTTEAIAAGNLHAVAQVERRDEIGRLAAAYEKMRLSLRSTIASLSQERRQSQAIIDATADGIIVVDEAFKIVKGNPAAEQLSGWSVEEAVGRYCWEALGFKETSVEAAEANERLIALMEALQSRSESSYLDLSITARDGQPRWLAISCSPLLLDETSGKRYTVIGLHDISQLKTVDQLKTDFVAMVSHELRAPLTTVTGAVEMLSQLDPPTEGELHREVVSILDQQTKRLRQVVEEVLQLTRFDAGHIDVHIQPVPLTGFLPGLVEKIQAEWSESDHCIVLQEIAHEAFVWADRGLLEIVLRNLLGNARKYTPVGTVIEVETERLLSSGQTLIRVIDHGPGIREDQLEHIFERFVRGTQPSRSWTRGYGLGLHIARELMLAQNGSIRAEQRETGACFVLTLWSLEDDPPSLPTETAPGKEQEE